MKFDLHGNMIDHVEWDGPIQPVIGYTDEKGVVAKRTKQSHPYSYDPIVQYIHYGAKVKANGSAYHDRMQSWDYKKYQDCENKHVRQANSSYHDGTAMQNFLRDYFDDPKLILIHIIEYCNSSSGYPCYRFDYYQVPKPAVEGAKTCLHPCAPEPAAVAKIRPMVAGMRKFKALLKRFR
jgi:hypothetical protein